MSSGSPNVSIKSCSFSIVVGSLTGPFWKGATIPAALVVAVSTLPIVKSTSLTTSPGDAKFRGFFFSPYSPELI